MGTDKAWLPFEGEPLLVRTIRRLARPGTRVLVAAGDPDREAEIREGLGREPSLAGIPLEVFRDPVSGTGPLGALSGLALHLGTDTERTLVCACDMPFLKPELARILDETRAATDPEPAIVVPRAGGRLQVLAALYDRRALDTARALFATGERRLHALLDALPVRSLGPEECAERGVEEADFENWNRPEDLPRPRST